MALNIKALTDLLDTKLTGNGPLSRLTNEILAEELGLTCLVEALNQKGFSPAEMQSYPCTQRKKKGKRLDAWVKGYLQGREVLFQVEIKGWNANSLGQGSFPRTDKDLASNARKRNWKIICKGGLDDAEIQHESVRKVLIRMKPDQSQEGLDIYPLVCIWLPLHPEGLSDCLFSAKLAKSQYGFSEVWFFSVSEFLSQRQDSLPLTLPKAEGHLRRLLEIFWARTT